LVHRSGRRHRLRTGRCGCEEAEVSDRCRFAKEGDRECDELVDVEVLDSVGPEISTR